MTARHFGRQLRHWLDRLSEAPPEWTDGQLLQRFLHERDEAAFALLVQRHGPLVLGVCRRLLHQGDDADDAFQATFLVLACRAAALRRADSLASFLHGTAYHIARRLRGQQARRQTLHQQAARQRSEANAPAEERESFALLHEELNRLPQKYRDVLILCYLQGKTHEQAARELGYAPGSMSRHVQCARQLLRERLLRRGVTAAVAAILTETANAAVPSALLHGTLDTVRRRALASAVLTGATPPAVLLARGVLRAAVLTRFSVASLLLAVSIVVAGGVAAWPTSPVTEPPSQARTLPAETKAPPAPVLHDSYGDPLPDGVLVRMGTSRLRHGLAAQLVFAADGKTLLSAGRDQTVRFWDISDGKLRRTKRMPLPSGDSLGQGSTVALSPDGKLLALPTGRGLTIHEVAADRDRWKLPLVSFGPSAFSPDGRIVAASAEPVPYPGDGSADYRKSMAALKVELWDTTTGQRLTRLDTGAVYWRAFSPDGRYLATAWMDGLHLWEIASGKEVLFQPAPEKRRSALARSFATRLAFAPDGRSVATGHDDTNVLVWDVAPATRHKRSLNEDDLDRLWNDLAGADAARAYRAAGTLIADAKHSVPYLSRRLVPVPKPAPRLRRQIDELDSEQFAIRAAARTALAKMGEAAYPALRQALKDNPSLELRRSIQNLLPASFVVQSPAILRQIRAVMVLEQIGDEASRRFLQQLTEGAAEARQTREAKAALHRLGER